MIRDWRGLGAESKSMRRRLKGRAGGVDAAAMGSWSDGTLALIVLASAAGVVALLYTVSAAIRDEVRVRETKQKADMLRRKWHIERNKAEEIIEVDEAPAQTAA